MEKPQETLAFILLTIYKPLTSKETNELSTCITRDCKGPKYSVAYAKSVYGVYDVVLKIVGEYDKNVVETVEEANNAIRDYVNNEYGSHDEKTLSTLTMCVYPPCQ